MRQHGTSRGLLTFIMIWFGQLVSLVGSGLTSFVLGVWVFQTTGSVTLYGLIVLSATLPNILLSLPAGALVDRWDRRQVMIWSDVGAGFSTLAVALLFIAGQIRVWHICLASAITSAFSAFQWPAYSASITLLVPKEQYGRANGMVQLAQAIGYIVSPVLAGVLLVKIHVQGVILIDFATLICAVFTLLPIRIARPTVTAEGGVGKGSLWREAVYGLTYLAARAGLFGILILFASLNFLMGFVNTLVTPMILAFTTADGLGTVITIGGIGMLVGGIAMSVWGGPKRRINGMLGFLVLFGLFIALGGVRRSVILVAVAAFGFFFCVPFISACSAAIWQSKIAPDIQGRAVAARSMVAQAAMPIAMLMAGPLADYVFEPLLVEGGRLAGGVGRLIGAGPGRGIGLMFILAGVLTTLAAAVGYLHPRIRRVEDELPDAAVSQVATAPETARGEGPLPSSVVG
jgi:MFS family permease